MPERLRRLLGAVLLVGAIAMLVAGCGSDDDSGGSSTQAEQTSDIPAKPESGTFRMGIEPWLGYGPWRVAEKQGLFEKNGLDVKITNFTTDDRDQRRVRQPASSTARTSRRTRRCASPPPGCRSRSSCSRT